MLRFIPQGILENGNQVISSLLPWEQHLLLIMAVAFFFLFLLGCLTIDYKIKKFNIGLISILAAIVLIALLFLAFFSFSIAASCGSTRGVIAFFAIPLGFAIAILSGSYIMTFCLGFWKLDLKAWLGFGVALAGMISAAIILALTLHNCS